MTPTEYISLGGLITICASACALVIKQVESSKCKKIRCCGVECDRRVDSPPASPVSQP